MCNTFSGKHSALRIAIVLVLITIKISVGSMIEKADDDSYISKLIKMLRSREGKTKINVSALDASPEAKLSADYVCDGSADNVQIQAALYEAENSNLMVQLVGKNFYTDESITIPNNVIFDLGWATINGTINLTAEVLTRNHCFRTPADYRTSATVMMQQGRSTSTISRKNPGPCS